MALIQSWTAPIGLLMPSVYFRVTELYLDVAASSAKVLVVGHVTEAARRSGKEAVFTRRYDVPSSQWPTYFAAAAMGTENCYQRAYAWLKAFGTPLEGAQDA